MCASRAQEERASCGGPSRSCLQALCCTRETMFADWKLHGNTEWKPAVLLQLTLLWAWSREETLTARWQVATTTIQGWYPEAFVFRQFQGFVNAMTKWTPRMVEMVKAGWHQRLEQLAIPEPFAQGGRTFVIDGTKVAVPWSDDHDLHLGNGTLSPAAKRRRKKRSRRSANSQAHDTMRPQIMMTLVWHLATGLPWEWKLGPVTESERKQAQAMLPRLPAKSLLVMDAGFTGFEFWQEILEAGHQLVVRVGSNVKLLKSLGWKVRTRGEFVQLWPDAVRKQAVPPLTLRLLKVKHGDRTIYLVTNVLSPHQLSDRQIENLYRERWGIEGWFRSLKQTFGKSKMRSKTVLPAYCELHWAVVGLGLIQLQGVEALVAAGYSPHDLSEAAAIRIVSGTVLHADFQPRDLARLKIRLASAVGDRYERRAPKAGRHVHRQRTTRDAAEPQIIRANQQQIRAAAQLQLQKQAA